MLRVAVVVKNNYISYISYISHISTLGGPDTSTQSSPRALFVTALKKCEGP